LIKDVVVYGVEQTAMRSSKFSVFATFLLSPIAFTQFIPVSYVAGCATAKTAPRNAVLRSMDLTHASPVVLRSSAPTSRSKSPFAFISNVICSTFSKTYHMALLEPCQSKAYSTRLVLILFLMEILSIDPPIGAVFFYDKL
ncbi:MAG TPA: hypothetical protein VIL90_09870, partial [Puia sp.]